MGLTVVKRGDVQVDDTDDDLFNPKIILEEYLDGNISHLDAHRLILESARNKDKEFLLYWCYELIYAVELRNLVSSKQYAVLLKGTTRQQ